MNQYTIEQLLNCFKNACFYASPTTEGLGITNKALTASEAQTWLNQNSNHTLCLEIPESFICFKIEKRHKIHDVNILQLLTKVVKAINKDGNLLSQTTSDKETLLVFFRIPTTLPNFQKKLKTLKRGDYVLRLGVAVEVLPPGEFVILENSEICGIDSVVLEIPFLCDTVCEVALTDEKSMHVFAEMPIHRIDSKEKIILDNEIAFKTAEDWFFISHIFPGITWALWGDCREYSGETWPARFQNFRVRKKNTEFFIANQKDIEQYLSETKEVWLSTNVVGVPNTCQTDAKPLPLSQESGVGAVPVSVETISTKAQKALQLQQLAMRFQQALGDLHYDSTVRVLVLAT